MRKDDSYYLISGKRRDTLLCIIHELFKEACKKKSEATDPKNIVELSRWANFLLELESDLRYADGGKVVELP